ncbi:hypothetical protein [Chryseobacterium foetidum]|uniref:hypothetical protein n=1 Tax=Chryseobacterium foetidum TaxID=2951057 RepID=UPI0021C6FC46|nr:hypothetical protein [Chryseobacterium foetidum]
MFFSQNHFDCEKEYNIAKQKYDSLFSDIKKVNYKSLPKVIIQNMDLKKFTGKNLILYYSNVVESDPSGVPKDMIDCKHFYPQIPYFNERKLWSGENILFLKSKIKKNIVPKTSFGFEKYNNEFVRLFNTENFREGLMVRSKEIYFPNSEKQFLYFPVNSQKLILKKVSNGADIYENSSTFITKVINVSSKEVKIEYIFENDPSLNYFQVFNFINDEWTLVKNE